MTDHAESLAFGGCTIRLLTADITRLEVDAIVNAANSELAGGGGVDGAIHRAAGPEVMQELDAIRAKIGRCPTGKAVVTGAGRLPAKYIFHAVGPIYRDGNHHEAELLASCYSTCLQLARERQVESIAFPSISTGVYGFPVSEASLICVQTLARELNRDAGSLREIQLVQFSVRDHQVYRQAAARLQASES